MRKFKEIQSDTLSFFARNLFKRADIPSQQVSAMGEVSGWTRTVLLALGAAGGVLAVAGLIHLAKQMGWIE